MEKKLQYFGKTSLESTEGCPSILGFWGIPVLLSFGLEWEQSYQALTQLDRMVLLLTLRNQYITLRVLGVGVT